MQTLSSGVVVKAKPLPVGYGANIARQHQTKKPKPPRLFVAELGRDEENPDDPDYLDALRQWQVDFAMSSLNLAMSFGLEIVSVPEGMMTYNSDEFKATLSFLGDDGTMPFVKWLQIIAAPTLEDLTIISNLPGFQAGVQEVGVQAEVETFRPTKARRTPFKSPA